jgi:hypothetical protein
MDSGIGNFISLIFAIYSIVMIMTCFLSIPAQKKILVVERVTIGMVMMTLGVVISRTL